MRSSIGGPFLLPSALKNRVLSLLALIFDVAHIASVPTFCLPVIDIEAWLIAR